MFAKRGSMLTSALLVTLAVFLTGTGMPLESLICLSTQTDCKQNQMTAKNKSINAKIEVFLYIYMVSYL